MMHIILGIEILFVIYCVVLICADSLLCDLMLWITEHWYIVSTCVCLIFLVVIVSEIFAVIGKNRRFALWFAFWNVLRSIASAQYLLFLLSDLAINYSTLGFIEKIFSIFGLQIAIIPLFAYMLFEIVIDKMGGASWKSVALGGCCSIFAMGIGAIIVMF